MKYCDMDNEIIGNNTVATMPERMAGTPTRNKVRVWDDDDDDADDDGDC
jgi:hypothetical protein